MEERGMNERIRNLRKVSMETQPHIDLERAKIETEVYKEWEDKVSLPVLRALVLKEYFSKKTLYLGEGELIVGEKGKDPQSSPTFPELTCHTLEDMHIMNDRKVVNYSVTEQDLKDQEEIIIPYWKGKSMRDKLLAGMTDEWKECYAAGMFTEFMEQRGPGHTCGGKNVFIKGYADYKEEIKAAIDALDFLNDVEAVSKKDELEAMLIDCDAVMILGERYRELLRSEAEKCSDPVRKAELDQSVGRIQSGKTGPAPHPLL